MDTRIPNFTFSRSWDNSYLSNPCFSDRSTNAKCKSTTSACDKLKIGDKLSTTQWTVQLIRYSSDRWSSHRNSRMRWKSSQKDRRWDRDDPRRAQKIIEPSFSTNEKRLTKFSVQRRQKGEVQKSSQSHEERKSRTLTTSCTSINSTQPSSNDEVSLDSTLYCTPAVLTTENLQSPSWSMMVTWSTIHSILKNDLHAEHRMGPNPHVTIWLTNSSKKQNTMQEQENQNKTELKS